MPYLCTVHSSEDTRFYCNECRRRICDVCVINECKGHRLERAKSEIDIMRCALKQKLEMTSQTTKENIVSFRIKLASVEENIEKARQRSEELKNRLDKVCDTYIEELMRCKGEMEKHFQTIEIKLQGKKDYAEESLRIIKTMNEDELQEVEERVTDHNGIDLSFFISPLPTFVEYVGKDEESALKAIFGYVQYGRYEEVLLPNDDALYVSMYSPEVLPKVPSDQQFTTEVVRTYTLGMSLENVLMKNNVFFVSSNSKLFETKLDKHIQSKELKDINENIRGIAMTAENVILMTSHLVYKLEKKNSIPKKYKVSNLIDPQGWLIACIGNTLDRKSLLLGLKITGEEESLEIRKYEIGEGDHLEYEKLELPRGIDIPLISHVTENTNGEICAVVRERPESSFFVCFDTEGRLRHRYPTDEKLKRKFLGIGILKDGMVALIDGCVISGIRFLDQYGRQLHFEGRKNVPKCITTDFNDHIWVGFDDGRVEKIQVTKQWAKRF
ncbi:uncharacterized protein LOC125659179 [Ostrea edulis]|uniref:uncharacterized protein LOC125659179 n=1 Tax=Ostrea edulis TaxID=37623 RepID=UPI0024AEDCD4|nr:uncharacterized protein LOC125659179 [Ostrea edulis]XP_056002384.1 uncharacterized protein LOC125659179 [Ostrea edulis]XP_056002393.1 uncharacterized protein LOC125659179 [Ostrea edulis]